MAGKSPTGKCYGFRSLNNHGQVVPDDGELAVVNHILALSDAGNSPQAIAGLLAAGGFATRYGAYFSRVQVKRIIDRRALYAGLGGGGE